MLVPPRNGSRSMSRTEAPVARGRDRRARTRGPGADDADVHVRDDRDVAAVTAGGSAVVEMTDQPPSTASD